MNQRFVSSLNEATSPFEEDFFEHVSHVTQFPDTLTSIVQIGLTLQEVMMKCLDFQFFLEHPYIHYILYIDNTFILKLTTSFPALFVASSLLPQNFTVSFRWCHCHIPGGVTPLVQFGVTSTEVATQKLETSSSKVKELDGETHCL